MGGLRIHVCGVSELDSKEISSVTHVVSIWDANMENRDDPRYLIQKFCPDAKVIHSFFDDVSSVCRTSPSIPAIRRILEFTNELNDDDSLLVHCKMGISRSTAIAYAACCQHTDPGQEYECYEAVRKARSIALPNTLIIRFADKILDRQGSMVRSVHTINPSPTSRPARCGICGRDMTGDTVYYDVPVGGWVIVCEPCFPSLGVCTGYARCELLPGGRLNWILEWG